MAAADFNDFCGQLCDLLSVVPPPLECDAKGRQAFTITHRRTDISFIDLLRLGGFRRISMLVKFGQPPRDYTGEVLANLMQANYKMQEEGLTFNQAPESGIVYLHTMFPYETVRVERIHARLDHLADWASDWRRDCFLSSQAPVTDGTPRTNFV